MKVKDLVKKLQKYDPNAEVLISPRYLYLEGYYKVDSIKEFDPITKVNGITLKNEQESILLGYGKKRCEFSIKI